MKQYWLCAAFAALMGCGGKSEEHAGSGGSSSLAGSGALQGGAGTLQGGSGTLPASGGTSAAGGPASGGAPPDGSGGSPQGGRAADGSGGNPGTVVAGPGVATRQLDLLLMIDNSLSMFDKQEVLARSLQPTLLRLASPDCVDAQGAPTGEKASPQGTCARGVAEFAPVTDMHIGIVTSSLGGHGSQTCNDAAGNDLAQLYPLVRSGSFDPKRTWNNSGFLAWDPAAKSSPPGTSDLAAFAADAQDLVRGVNQTGCGFESQLESWYRFLIDPDPPVGVPQVSQNTVTMPTFVPADQNPILQQRAKFLRPDSLVAVLMLTDENDCSIIDAGQGWLVGQQTLSSAAFHMPRSTSACDTNPNSPCCFSCASTVTVSGCPKATEDTACRTASYLTPQEDALNLRCFKQKERFGFDLLYPTSRYIDGLTRSVVLGHDGNYVQNPLFPAGSKRTAAMVFLGGILGVPWQDVATAESLSGPGLRLMSFKELVAAGRWPLMLGDPGNENTPPSAPGDKLMFESIVDRTQLFGAAPHPLVGATAALAPATSAGRPNAINGREMNIKDNDDLQYACIFPLLNPRVECTGAGCECQDQGEKSPTCIGTTQTHAKAYPSLRELQVLKGVGDISGNAVVASICARSLNDSDTGSYGYVPAMSALVNALKPALR